MGKDRQLITFFTNLNPKSGYLHVMSIFFRRGLINISSFDKLGSLQRVKFPATIRKRGLQRPQKIEYIENTIR